jgi:hypothetical protein
VATGAALAPTPVAGSAGLWRGAARQRLLSWAPVPALGSRQARMGSGQQTSGQVLEIPTSFGNPVKYPVKYPGIGIVRTGMLAWCWMAPVLHLSSLVGLGMKA